MAAADKPARPLAKPEDVAEWLQTSTDRLAKMRAKRIGPPYVRLGRSVRYSWSDVHAWAASQRQTHGR